MPAAGGRAAPGGFDPSGSRRASTGPEERRRILSLLDLTSLGEDDTEAHVRRLCASAQTALGTPAAVCLWPRFLEAASKALEAAGLRRSEGAVRGVRLATVANFPAGAPDPHGVAAEVAAAVALAADEVDVVVPWRALRQGDAGAAAAVVAAARRACGDRVRLKAILETGELADPGLIREAGHIAAEAGAHFLKTSTGKVAVGATPEAVAALLEVIRERDGSVGLKISGGVRTVDQAAAYLRQVEVEMGPGWVTPDRVRFGASSLLDQLLEGE